MRAVFLVARNCNEQQSRDHGELIELFIAIFVKSKW